MPNHLRRSTTGDWLLSYVLILHVTWSLAALVDASALNATAPSTLLRLPHSSPLGVILGLSLASLLAGIGLLPRCPRAYAALLLMPQQFIVLVCGGGALLAVLVGEFADGVTRPHAFILSDQAPAILLAVLHTSALVSRHRVGLGARVAKLALRFAGSGLTALSALIAVVIVAVLRQYALGRAAWTASR